MGHVVHAVFTRPYLPLIDSLIADEKESFKTPAGISTTLTLTVDEAVLTAELRAVCC
jgi:hypothetical protein